MKSISRFISNSIQLLLIFVLSIIFMQPIFLACCLAVDTLGKLLGLSYKDINVYIFIIGQPAILFISAIVGIIYCIKNKYWLLLPSYWYIIPFIKSLFIMTENFENMLTTTELFDLAVKDLIELGRKTYTNYQFANFIVFIFGFMFVFIITLIPFFIQKDLNKTFYQGYKFHFNNLLRFIIRLTLMIFAVIFLLCAYRFIFDYEGILDMIEQYKITGYFIKLK